MRWRWWIGPRFDCMQIEVIIHIIQISYSSFAWLIASKWVNIKIITNLIIYFNLLDLKKWHSRLLVKNQGDKMFGNALTWRPEPGTEIGGRLSGRPPTWTFTVGATSLTSEGVILCTVPSSQRLSWRPAPRLSTVILVGPTRARTLGNLFVQISNHAHWAESRMKWLKIYIFEKLL